MSVYSGAEVRRAGGGLDDPTGVVVERFTAPRPDWPGQEAGTQAIEDWRIQCNVAEGLPAQVTVFWSDTRRLERLLDTEVQFAFPHATYRAGDFEFPLLAIETGGYCDYTVLDPQGNKVVYLSTLDEPDRDDMSSATFRTHLHRLIDLYIDEVDRHLANDDPAKSEMSAGRQTATATPAV